MAQPTKVWSIRGVGMGDRMGRGWECGGRAVTTNSGDLESFENTFRRIPPRSREKVGCGRRLQLSGLNETWATKPISCG